MKVYLTGATGYLGASLAADFFKRGDKVAILKRNDSSLDYLDKISDEITFYNYEDNFQSIDKSLSDFSPDLVIHLASFYIFKASPYDIDNLIDSNIRLGIYLLESMVKNEVRYLINTGTSFEHFENSNYNPSTLYAATKYAFQNILEYYIQSKKIKAVTLKLFDTYGKGDKRKKLLWLLKERIQDHKSLKLSKGEQLLDLLFIKDLQRAYKIAVDSLMDGKLNGQVFALSGNDRVTLVELIRIVEEITGREINKDLGAYPYREREIMIPWNRFETLPGWQPEYSLKEGLKIYFSEFL